MGKEKIIVILGPTASGKSDLAVALAKKFDGEIISADSRQVYKGLNIGTGKITRKEMRGVPHYLINIISPQKRFSAADFVKYTNCAIAQIVCKNKLPIICGGTGFYIDALLGDKNIPEVPPNEKLRKKLEKKTVKELFEILKKLDPERSQNIDSKNPRRLIRAIEICMAIGKVPKFESRSMNYEVCKIGIKISDTELKEKINERIKKWFKIGLLKEVRNLHKKGLSWKRMSEIGLEYKLVANFLRAPLRMSKGDFDTSQLKKNMAEKTWQYAKRQMTWFKRDEKINWFGSNEIKKIERFVSDFLS